MAGLLLTRWLRLSTQVADGMRPATVPLPNRRRCSGCRMTSTAAPRAWRRTSRRRSTPSCSRACGWVGLEGDGAVAGACCCCLDCAGCSSLLTRLPGLPPMRTPHCRAQKREKEKEKEAKEAARLARIKQRLESGVGRGGGDTGGDECGAEASESDHEEI